MRFVKWLLASLLACSALPGESLAQPISNVDTLRILPANFSIPNPAVSTNFKVAIFMKNATTLGAVAVPIKYVGLPNLRIDSTINPGTTPGVSQGPAGAQAAWTLRTSFVDNAGKGILVGYVSFTQVNPGNDTLAYVHFDYDAGASSAIINLDSGVVNNQHLGITDVLANEFVPRWSKGTITVGTPQPTITLSPTSMIFNGVIGTANPPPQALAITNTGVGTLSWTAVTTQAWLSVNPSSGSGNGNPNVSVNIAGLIAGTHTGWVIVSDPAASNTPESVFVSLNLTRPTLAAAPPSLAFTAVAGSGTNPAAQSIQLSASQGAAIAWTGTKTNSWLTINPASGTTPNSVSASVNIAGLPAATHRDTIVITSANAANSPLRIPVVLTLTAPPTIALEPLTLSFQAQQGGPNPAPDTVVLTNAGQGVLDFAAAPLQPWLAVTPAAGNAPAFLQVSADVTGLSPGPYTGHIVITSTAAANSPETVTVSLNVGSAPPFLSVQPTTAAFTATEGDLVGSPLSTSVVINNTGSGTLAWSITGKDSAWVVLSKLSGGGPDTLLVSVSPAGRLTGTYQEVFQIVDPAAQGSPVNFTVNLEVLPGPPTIAVAPSSFHFTAVLAGSNPASQSLSITNVGGSLPLDWTAAHGPSSWLSLSNSSGTAPSAIDLSIDIAGLALGTYQETVTVTSAEATNSPQQVPVTLEIIPPPPQIAVAPDSFTFTATLGDPNPPAQALAITNSGGGTLDWTLVTEGSWLSTSTASGTAPANVDVSVNLSGLPPGTHPGALLISGAGAANSPVRVPVVLVLNDLPPVLSVAPTSLSFQAQQDGAAPAAQTFAISNLGGSVLTWNVTTAAPWIASLDPPGGSQADEVAVSLDISGLVAGSYVDSVLVDAGAVAGSPQYVHVTLELLPPPPPEIVLQPTSFLFTALFGGSAPASKTLNVTNGGGRELAWTASNGEDWLSLSDAAGTAPSVITLDVDPSGLPAGVYYDTVQVASDSATNSPQVATVELRIVDNPPVIVAAPAQLNFEKVKGDVDPPCQSVQITNAGAGELNWTASKKAGWLILSAAAGTAPSSVDVCVLGSTLVAGTYRDTIWIQGPDATNSPQRVIVTFVVKSVAKPAIVLQPDSLYFRVSAGSHTATLCTYVFINGNGGRLVWRARTDAPWIDLSHDSCNISYPLCVTVDATGLAAGAYCDSVEVSGDASNSPQFLVVCMDVVSEGEQPLLAVTPSAIELTVPMDAGFEVRQLSITNVGSGSLTWSINPGLLAPWLSVSSTAGTAPGTTDLTIQPLGLTPGTYTDTVLVVSAQAGNSPIGVPVLLTVTGFPAGVDSVRLATDTASPGDVVALPVYFDNSRPLLGVSVPLTWSGVGVWPDSVSFVGSRAADTDILAASVDTALREIRIGLIPSAVDPLPAGSGLLATVYFTVSFWSPNQVVDIDTATTSAPAITLLYVDTLPSEHVPGFRLGHIVVQGAEPPVLAVVPDSLHFAGTAGGANPAPQHLRVTNVGGSFLTFLATESVPWLAVNPASGRQGDSVFFTVNLAGLAQNLYSGVVRFVSPEALDTVDVSVSLDVQAAVNPPVMVLSPDVLNFTMVAGVPPPSQTITVLNTGGGSLAWSATKTQTWFSATPGTGGAGQMVTVTITNAGLAVGTYKDTLTFVDPGASNSPRKAAVILQVQGPPKPDTVRVAHVSAQAGDTVLVGVSIKNTFDVTGITLPFKYSGTGVTLVTGTSTSRSGTAIFPIFANTEIDPVAQTGLFGFISFANGMPPGDGDVLILKFAIAPDAPDQVIRIDTTSLPPSNRLVLNDLAANEIFPDFLFGTITVGTGGTSSILITDATGDAGDQVEVEVVLQNASPVDGLILPLRLTSPDVRIVSATFAGTRAESGDPMLQVTDDQHFTLSVDWSGATLPAGTGPVAKLLLELSAQAQPQEAYVDTAGEYGLQLGGGSQGVEVPGFERGTVTLRVPTAVGDPALPWVFGLDPNYPNPFNPATRISYTLAASGHVRLEVFNTLGRRVVTLVDEHRPAGAHTVMWDGRDGSGSAVPSGVYLYRLASGTESALRKMTLMK
jgi:hypothetical protein